MREILVRGKRDKRFSDRGEWIYGIPQKFEGKYTHIRNSDGNFCIIPETLGEYTGLTDRNGKRIFEGDILKSFDALYTVDWIEESAMFYLKPINVSEGYDFDTINSTCYEIIGNIHDNPELLNAKYLDDGVML